MYLLVFLITQYTGGDYCQGNISDDEDDEDWRYLQFESALSAEGDGYKLLSKFKGAVSRDSLTSSFSEINPPVIPTKFGNIFANLKG